MEFRIQDFVLDATLCQHSAQFFTGFDGNGTYQYGLAGGVCFLYRIHDSVQLLFFRLVYGILKILTDDGTVGGNHYHVHAVDLTELGLLGESRTGHTALFIKQVKEVLESNGRQRLTLSLYLHMLFRLDGLMQTVGITTSRHNTSGKLIDDQYLIILYHIILVAEHQIVCTQCQNDVVLDLQILGIRKVINMEESLYLFHTCCSQVDDLILLVDYEVSGLFLYHAHDGIHLGQFLYIVTTLHLTGQQVAHLIQCRRLTTLSGNDQRGSRFIDQYGVHLIDDGIMQSAQNQLFLVDDHIITQIIKSQLVVRHIGDVAVVGCLSLLGGHAVKYHTDLQSQELMYLSHPLGITLCQIVVDGNNMDTLAFQRIQIGRKSGHQGLTFTGTHLCDTSLMQDDTTDQLYSVVLHVQNTLCSLSYGCIRLRKQIIQRLSIVQTHLVFVGLAAQFLIGKCLHRRTECLDLVHQGLNTLQFSGTVRAKYLLNNVHFFLVSAPLRH